MRRREFVVLLGGARRGRFGWAQTGKAAAHRHPGAGQSGSHDSFSRNSGTACANLAMSKASRSCSNSAPRQAMPKSSHLLAERACRAQGRHHRRLPDAGRDRGQAGHRRNSRSSWLASATRSASAWSPAWRGPAATSPACPAQPRSSAARISNSSGRRCRPHAASPCWRNTPDPFHKPFLENILASGRTLGIEIKPHPDAGRRGIRRGFAEMETGGPRTIIVQPSLPHTRSADDGAQASPARLRASIANFPRPVG